MKFLLIVLALFSVTAFAKVDLEKSEFKWKVDKKIIPGHQGTIKLKSADIVEEKGAIKSGTLVMDITSFQSTDLTGDMKGKLEGHLKSPDFFDVAKYPTATLKIKSVKGNTITADLTVKDKTSEVIFDAKKDKDGKAYVGTLTFDRTKFGMTYNSGNYVKDLAADKIIKDEIVLDFKVANI